MSKHKRSCGTCDWTGTYDSAARGDYAKRKHSRVPCSCSATLCRHGFGVRSTAASRSARRFCPASFTVHFSHAAYVLDRCRCLPCSKANATAEMQRERQKAYGRYDKYVDAEPIRAHVLALGMGLKRVAKAAGVSTGTLSKLVFGVYADTGTGGGRNGAGVRVRQPSKRVLRTTADKVLAVQLVLADGAKVDATGTTRRVRALVALGWSQSKIADDPTYKPGSLTPDAVEDEFDEAAIYRRTHGDRAVKLTKAEKVELVRRWVDGGRSLIECERITGINVHRAIRELEEAS